MRKWIDLFESEHPFERLVWEVRNEYAPNFQGSCEGASADLAERLRAIGYDARVMQGMYDYPYDDGEVECETSSHVWVEIPGYILDPTVEQFESDEHIAPLGSDAARMYDGQEQMLDEGLRPSHVIDLEPIIQQCIPWLARSAYARSYVEGTEEEINQWCEQQLRNVAAQIVERIRGDYIQIWRAITLPEGEEPNMNQYPGVCWTWDEDAIHPAHGNLRDHIWVFKAEVETDQIEWGDTLFQNAQPGFADEKEIRIKMYAHLDNLEVYDTGETK